MIDAKAGRWRMVLAGVGGLAVGTAAMAAIGGQPQDKAAIEAVVRNYILQHPEVIPEAMQRLQDRETGKRLATDRTALETPFSGAWAGAAKPDVTLVMFSDYACGYCRASVADVDRLLASDPKLRVVWREIPILGPKSDAAARMALGAAQQGRYLDVHRRIFAGGVPEAGKISAAARAAGIDEDKAMRDGKSATVNAEIENNLALAQKIGVSGTPAFVVGNQMLSGAVGYDALKKAVAEARAAKS